MSIQVHQDTILWGSDIQGSATRATEAICTNRNTPSNNQKELQSFLGIINYMGKFYPETVDIRE